MTQLAVDVPDEILDNEGAKETEFIEDSDESIFTTIDKSARNILH